VTTARPADLAEFAPAKVNLTLHVLGRREDGYHELESLVVFADAGDRLSFTPGAALDLDVSGPTADAAGASSDNLVLKAARALAERVGGLRLGRFRLEKHLPVAAGLGGGSSDAAAALRLLGRNNDLSLDDDRLHAAARATGADVPVCLAPRGRMMRGIGELLSATLRLPELPAVLVNPGVAVATRDVFTRLAAPPLTAQPVRTDHVPAAANLDTVLSALSRGRNDLERPAIALQPVIGDVLARLRGLADCRLARMSGSGATCFGLFGSAQAARDAAQALQAAQPGWWVRATAFS
jgi:4-diphosphocytidyl-2-C-methyl-D-erythritol kinase